MLVNEPIPAAADAAARERLESIGWDIEAADEHILVTEATCPPGTPGFEHFEQAQVDDLVVVFYTWPVGAPDE